MAATSSRTNARRPWPTAARPQRDAGGHERAVLEAEVRRILRSLRPFGILHRDALSHAVGARSWRKGSFEAALRAAIDRGRVERLPGGFCRIRDPEW